MIRSASIASRVRRIVLDRPEARNALRPAELTALDNAVRDADEPVVLLEGRGSAFCAGADLDTLAAVSDPAEFAAHGQRVARRLADTDAIVVAGVDGPARGGGVELALACDLRIATRRATFAENGVRLGLFGAWGGTRRIRRELPAAVARDLALSGRVIDATEARRVGLVSRIADPEQVAREVAEVPPDALERVGRLCRAETDRATSEAAEREAFATLHANHADRLD